VGLSSGGEKNSAVEAQNKDSEGTNLMAENRIFPSIDLSNIFNMAAPRRANRSDISTYSYVRLDGESKTRSGTQCVEATSVGCNLSCGVSGSIYRNTKGQRTIMLYKFLAVDLRTDRRRRRTGPSPKKCSRLSLANSQQRRHEEK
jgi:hypothetical protein